MTAVPDWDKLVSRHGQAVWQTCYRLLGNSEDAADCYQDVFVSALELSRREKIAAWPGLLKHLATRRALDRLRQRYRQRSRFGHWSGSDSVTGTDAGPEEQAVNRELASQLKAGLVALPAIQSEAFCLRFLDQLTYAEIAEHLRVDINQVGVMIHRARVRLRTFLQSLQKGFVEREPPGK